MVEKKKRGRPRKRARTSKGRYIADNPNTPQNEAYVVENTIIDRIKGYVQKITKIFSIR
tara:strand:- start:213 stop:389 length:177 start_codon:yes stop_codon:yes gene_type:complete